jgi:hypothetical protein
MLALFRSGMRTPRTWMLALAFVGSLVALLRPSAAQAHCDAVNGPVVDAARKALAAGDVSLILPYAPESAEAELTAAFAHTLEVRALGGEAAALADRYFFETAVRLHRAGEGAPYTGLKEDVDFGPALEAADEVLAGSSPEDVTALLVAAIENGVRDRYEAIKTTRTEATEAGTVEANRERVEAELGFEKYVYDLYQMITGGAAGTDGPAEAAAAGNGHKH